MAREQLSQSPEINISANIDAVRSEISRLDRLYNRTRSTRLLAVGKTKPVSQIAEAAAAGQLDFGENYLQEALTKQAALKELALRWHFIGPVQSNKTRKIATQFDWLHSLESLKVAKRLNSQRPAHLPKLEVLIQVNVFEESSKSGVAPAQLFSLASEILDLDQLHLAGLMMIPAPATTIEQQRQPFARLRELLEQLQDVTGDTTINELSMGMSGDLEAAIAEGATIVRIGTAIFGRRESRAQS